MSPSQIYIAQFTCLKFHFHVGVDVSDNPQDDKWLYKTTITRFLFYVEIDEPVEPGKRKPPACFDNSHGSVANLGAKKCQIYYKPLDATITTISDRFD